MDDDDDRGYSRAPELEDLVTLCRALNDEEARYILIGGFAVILHGYVRATKDIDLLVDSDPLGRAVASGGKLLFCSDAEKNHQWVRDVQLMAADLDPFLDRMRKIKLEALAQ